MYSSLEVDSEDCSRAYRAGAVWRVGALRVEVRVLSPRGESGCTSAPWSELCNRGEALWPAILAPFCTKLLASNRRSLQQELLL